MDRDLHLAHADLDETHWWFVARMRIVASVLDRFDVRGPVLDIGCGAGGLLPVLARYGHVTAIETEPSTAAKAALRNPQADVIVGWIPDAVADVPAVRLATAFDVIEHLDDDVAALAALGEKVGAGGHVVVTVPALPWLWSEHDDANQHRRRYTHRTLEDSMTAAGLVVEHISYFNMLLLPMVAIARLVERVRPGGGGGDFDRSLGPFDRLLERVFAFERHLVPRVRLPIGVSLIAVAHPRE